MGDIYGLYREYVGNVLGMAVSCEALHCFHMPAMPNVHLGANICLAEAIVAWHSIGQHQKECLSTKMKPSPCNCLAGDNLG